MVPATPTEALARHASTVKDTTVEVIRSLHDRFAEAHQVSESRYTSLFGAQWRDLLDEVVDAMTERGYQTHTLSPAGYKIPVANDCLVYVWRVPESGDAASFASSPTRVCGFSAPPPEPMLFEPGEPDQSAPSGLEAEQTELDRVAQTFHGVMPLVLVMVHSSPRQLQAIDWAIAELDVKSGEVGLRGLESIWSPESEVDQTSAEVESFASGTPSSPTIELREQEGNGPDA